MHISQFFHAILHLNDTLPRLVARYGAQTYAILFAAVFAETGLVIFPFLPGDSLLFAAGAVAASASGNGSLNGPLLYPLFFCAALMGDNVNYWIGRTLGRRLFHSDSSKLFQKGHLAKTEAFFEKYGTKAIILARFVPIIRTFAPFVAGMGQMHYARFLLFSVIGATLWVGLCVTAGQLFGHIPAVKGHFDIVVLAVVALSLAPMIIEFVIHRKQKASESGTID